MALRIETSLQQRPELRMRLAPQIIQSIEILQLPMLELQQRIKQELVENPVLEIEEPTMDLVEAPSEQASQTEDSGVDEEVERVEALEELWRQDGSGRPVRTSDEHDPKREALENVAARPMTLQEYLSNQLSLIDASEEVRRAAQNIIYNIDDNGYLRFDLDAVRNSMDPPLPSRETLEEALALVQSLDPPGVGARDLRECLLLQLRNEKADRSLERELITNHLDDLSVNRFPKIVKATGRSIEEIKQAKDFISHLNPRPGALFGSEMSQYITPDVIVDYVDGRYEVRLEEEHIPRLYISPAYRRILREARESQAKEYIRKKINAARWLIDAIEQRRNTLYKIACEIVELQREFFDRGLSGLKPLKMQTVADRTGVHVSTVSRAIADKYMQTPRGIFSMKYFFTGGTNTTKGTVVSRKTVKQHILDLIGSEDKRNPLSDDAVAAKLQAAGFDISRRTVSKYRQAMNIPASRERREY